MRLLPLVLSFAAFLGVLAAFPQSAVARQLPSQISVHVSSMQEAKHVGELSAKLGYHANFERCPSGGWTAKLGMGLSLYPPVCP